MDSQDFVSLDYKGLDDGRYATWPPEDFVDAQFDQAGFYASPKGVLLVFSTPRSGSTYLCDLIRRHDFCMPHEYFQDDQYMQILSDRWQVRRDRGVVAEEYFKALVRNRTGKTGWLGINVHAGHLETLRKFMPFVCEYHHKTCVMSRLNVVAQAVSWDIAAQSQKWRSEFLSDVELKYSYRGIERRLFEILNGNRRILKFLAEYGLEGTYFQYENVVKQPNEVARLLDLYAADAFPEQASDDPNMKRQASLLNLDWEERFIMESRSRRRNVFRRLWA